MSTKPIRLSLRFLIYREAGQWLGHCLDLDIVAEGASPGDALKSCVELCTSQIKYAYERGDIESIFRSAPSEYWHMFSVAQDYEFLDEWPEPMENAEVRELEFA